MLDCKSGLYLHLNQFPEVDAKNIYVLGHSQGGYALPAILDNDKNHEKFKGRNRVW